MHFRLGEAEHQKTHATLFFYRTSNGEEIDVIIDRKSRREFIEIKTSETFTPRMTKTIEQMLEKNDTGYLVYRGEKRPYLPSIQVINYQDFLS